MSPIFNWFLCFEWFSFPRYLLTRTAMLKVITRWFLCSPSMENGQKRRHQTIQRLTSCNLLGISSTIQAAIPRTICQYVSTFSLTL